MKNQSTCLPGLLLAGACLLSSCSNSNPVTPGTSNAKHEFLRSSLSRETQPSVPTANLETLVAGNHEFATDIYAQLKTDDANFMFSPLSIRMAFALLQGGARGATEAEIGATMHYSLSGDDLHSAFNALDLALTARNVPKDAEHDPVELSVANSFWGQNDFLWKQEYLDLIAENYGAGIETLDFQNAPESARTVINDWVETRTRERIKNLLPEGSIDPSTVAVLVNALYFKAPWALQFNPQATVDASFNLLNDSLVQTAFMNQTESFNYSEGAGYQALELPFHTNTLSMVFVLPDAGTFKQFENNLSTHQLDQIIKGLENSHGTVSIPKFKFEAGFGLKNALTTLGMTTTFDTPDLSGMVDNQRLYIEDVFHKTFIAINEEGAEAAASTAIIVGVTSTPSESFSFTADRPFVFLIRDRITGAILFFGRLTNPIL
ncbi:MAG TPA: serpin family protein [Gammaproteobacteria bacterium]|nr:serpin family protein [Gammaproteobacteria bacterium]